MEECFDWLMLIHTEDARSRLASSRAAATDQLGHVPIVTRRCRPAAQ